MSESVKSETNLFSDLSDEEFVPFLKSLGVETYNKSFEWMLSDPDFAGIFRWIYNNLDCRNALTAREEYRYNELKKKGQLLSPTELEAAILSILNDHKDLPLPGDQDALEDIKTEKEDLTERLNMLEKQECVLKDLVRQNEIANEELNCELTRLNAQLSQCKEDESKAAEECLALAQEVQTVTESVVDVIAETLTVYENCHTDKETAKEFFAFGPFDAYKQSQVMFRSHFDLYITRKFNRKLNENLSAELKTGPQAVGESKALEERLSIAISSYIDTKAELCGKEAKLSFLLSADYDNVHPAQIPAATIDARGAVDLLEQEESILKQQIQLATQQLVEERTAQAAEAAAQAALAVREEMFEDLSHLHEITRRALALDRCLYFLLRQALCNHEEFLQFAAELAQYVKDERTAAGNRLDSMKAICEEQQTAEENLKTRDVVLTTLCAILDVPPTNDVVALVRLNGKLERTVKELKEKTGEGFRRKEESIEAFKRSQQPIVDYLWDGCTKQPNCHSRPVAALTHDLTREMEAVEKKVAETSSLYTTVKNGDKSKLRKLWQWFLTDHGKFAAVMKEAQLKS